MLRARAFPFVLAATVVLAGEAQAQQKAPPAPPVPAEAKRLEAAFAAASDRVAASVVQLLVTVREEAEGRFARNLVRGDGATAGAAGSGLIVGADGAIVTNNALIEDALTLQVRLLDGRVLPAKLVGRDPATDLALLRIEGTGFAAARPAEVEPKVGQWAVAVGAPFASGNSLAVGVVSNKPRRSVAFASIDDALLTDIQASASTTGGPLVDLEGRVLGITSAALSRESGTGVVVPMAAVKRVLAELAKSGRVTRPTLGASLQDLTPELAAAMKVDVRAGAIITQVADGGPAKKANLEPGDVVATFDGKPLRDAAELTREVLAKDVAQVVNLEVLRQGKRYSTQVTLGPRPDAPLAPVPVQQQGVPQVGLGFNVRDLSIDESKQRGLPAKALPLVTVVAPGSSADRAGLKVGDVIVEADGVALGAVKELQQASLDGQLLVRVRRRDAAFYAILKR